MKRFKYFLIMLLVCFFAPAPLVKAEVRFNDQTIKFINRTYYDFPFTTRFNVGENTTYKDNYVLLDDKNFEDFNGEDDLPKYLYLVYCGSTNIDFETTNVTVGRVSNNGPIKGTSCEVIHDGNYYRGNYYLNRWYIDFDYIQDTIYGIKWDIKIHNTSNSIYYIRAESMFLSNELIQDFSSDYLLSELLAQNSNLRTELNDVKTNTSETNNKLDETNQELGELNENITNDKVDSGTGSDFFDSFATNDNGGISAIITAPLSAIEKMVSGTCIPITGSYKGKNFSFPCGNTFWTDMPDVKQFLNVVLGGFLCYGILAKLYLLIDRLKDPEDDRVDVMKL